MALNALALPNETPEQHMRRLGQMSQKIMDGRINAMAQGLTAIHTALARVSDEIQTEQNRVLNANPELIMMVMQGEK